MYMIYIIVYDNDTANDKEKETIWVQREATY